MTLAETQALFHAAVTGRAGPAAVEACFAGTPELGAPERLRIYAGMWLWRQVDALREEFPRLAGLLGEGRFADLCRAYLRRHPSRHHDIGRLGRLLSPYLRRFPDPERPDLADLAALEWARSEAFFEAEAAPAGREALSALPARDFPRARLRLVPALRLLDLRHDAASTWRRLERGQDPGPAAAGPVAVAVWRAGHQVFHAALPPAEASALRSALAGRPLRAVCRAFEAERDPARAAFASIASWLDEGWVAAVRRPRRRRGA